MSSPLARERKSWFDRAMIGLHQRTSHSHRVQQLAQIIADLIRARHPDTSALRAIDIGCGDMSLSTLIAEHSQMPPWHGIDLYALPAERAGQDIWTRYAQFDGRHIPSADAAFDVGLLCDVLHHASVDDQAQLLSEALRVCNVVIVKDHIEHGIWSRHMLRLMDYIGNHAYGVSVPRRYFTNASFAALVHAAGGVVVHSIPQIALYSHLPLGNRLLRAHWQFIAVIERRRPA